ncbi:outer membrane biogenesis protein BamB [Planctopirus ephydatiae]|uniref:Outer membrane biogenesis protein BamB n=1 Tax=Planctopirus ephydatiae TaxID=2528019 RepID=A0A518GPN3_9PLAN|nr:PQQ-binding-like beta-propeller repeat protein [Planctopirus ephydatiae]QDV30499.1 outer membrane biogenesis protein BamB [Planctopirus ephydatiae]
MRTRGTIDRVERATNFRRFDGLNLLASPDLLEVQSVNMKYLTNPFLSVLLCTCFASAADWPQFRGPNRDGKSLETGLLKQWPDDGPKLLRTITGFGQGYATPAISGERIYISGKVGDDLKLFCFDLLGQKLWEKTHGLAFRESDAPHSPYPGSRAAPTIDGDTLYLLGGLGKLNAYRTRDGELLWTVDVVKDLAGRVPPWGYTESVLIDGNNLICTPGSVTKGTFAALNKKTGQVVWQSGGITARAEYGSPILIEYDGVRQVVTMSRAGLVAVSPEDGKFLWQYNRMAKTPMAESNTAHGNSAAYADGYVFEATAYQTRGGCAVHLKSNGSEVTSELAWQSDKLNCEHGGYVVVDGYIYMSQGAGWSCLELKTGKERWSGRGPGKGSIIYAEGMLYCLGEDGRMGLIEARPNEFNQVSVFALPEGEGRCWTHPVINDGKLYLRWGDKLHVYELHNQARTTRP